MKTRRQHKLQSQNKTNSPNSGYIEPKTKQIKKRKSGLIQNTYKKNKQYRFQEFKIYSRRKCRNIRQKEQKIKIKQPLKECLAIPYDAIRMQNNFYDCTSQEQLDHSLKYHEQAYQSKAENNIKEKYLQKQQRKSVDKYLDEDKENVSYYSALQNYSNNKLKIRVTTPSKHELKQINNSEILNIKKCRTSNWMDLHQSELKCSTEQQISLNNSVPTTLKQSGQVQQCFTENRDNKLKNEVIYINQDTHQDDTDEETIDTVKQQLKLALLEEVTAYLKNKLMNLKY